MKRMKKKVVAMVTLAMFLMTLLPVAAFAASTPVDANKTLTAAKTAVTGEEVTVTVAADAGVTGADVWVEDANGVIVRNGITFGSELTGQLKNGVQTGNALNDKATFTVKFAKAGKYVVKAGYENNTYVPGVGAPGEFTEFVGATVEVTAAPVKTVAAGDVTFSKIDEVNGVVLKPVTVTVTDVNSQPAADGTVVKIKNAYEANGIKTVDKLHNVVNSVEVTGGAGQATFYVSADRNALVDSLYYLYVTSEDGTVETKFAVNIPEVDPDNAAATIEAVPVNGVLTATQAANGGVQFVIKNAAGTAITAPKDEPICGDTVTGHNDQKEYVVISKQPVKPDGSKVLAAADIELAELVEGETMKMTFNSKTLIPGDYEISVALKNGKWATTSFTVAAFDEKNIVETKIVAVKGGVVVDNNIEMVASGKKFAGNIDFKVVNVDKNGLTQDSSKNYRFAIDKATADAKNVAVTLTLGEATNGNIAATYEGEKLEDVLGTKIPVYAVSADGNLKTEFTLTTPAANATDYDLFFDYKEGVTLTNNTVKFDVKTSDKKTSAHAIEEVIIEKVGQSNKDAKVYINDTNAKSQKKFTVYSDKDTTVDIRVVVVAKNKSADTANVVYSDTITYTIGNKVAPQTDNTLVALTIGSKDMIVNNEVVKIDAAPFVDKNWRTMVPLSAITEAFGVTPEWNEKDRSVTVEMNGVKVVMTIDKQAYTVNGEKKTMDTAPVIVNSRTMVPVRFVAEELGFKVAPIMSDKGLTEGVVISK